MEQVLLYLAKILNTTQETFKRIMPQVVSLNKALYTDIYPPIGYAIKTKLDGIRTVGLHDGKNICYITSNTMKGSVDLNSNKMTIIDSEMVDDEIYVFDVLMIIGVNIINLPFEERMINFSPAADIFGVRINNESIITETNLEECVMKYGSDTEGIILVKPGYSYIDTTTYKWKHQNSIDFLAKHISNNLYHLYIRMNNSTRAALLENRKDVLFEPATSITAHEFYTDVDVHNKVVELVLDNNDIVHPKWKLLRIRADKTIDEMNDFLTANAIWSDYIDPLTLDHLWQGPPVSYFQHRRSSIYTGLTSSINTAKAHLIYKYATNVVVDIGTGNGQDINKYLKSRTKMLIAIEKCKTAIVELMRRRNLSKIVSSMKLHIINADINVDKIDLSIFKVNKVGLVVCNLAVHYFLESTEHMKRFCALINNILDIDRPFIITCMDGEEVFHRLGDKDRYDLYEPGTSFPKYSIVKEYKSSTFEVAGQQIGVKLPFATDQYYSEYLVNISALEEALSVYGFRKVAYNNINIGRDPMTDIDKEYLSLFCVVIFQKEKIRGGYQHTPIHRGGLISVQRPYTHSPIRQYTHSMYGLPRQYTYSPSQRTYSPSQRWYS